MKYLNVSKLMAILSAGVVLVSLGGCKTSELEESSLPEATKDYVEGTSDVVKEEAKQIDTYEGEKVDEDTIVKYFSDLEHELDTTILSEKVKNFKERAKEIAITAIDFVFYDGEIKGVTFSQLSDTTKEKILAITSSIDSKIESKIPNYKETIKDKFTQGYDYVKDKLKQGIGYVDDKLEDKYGDSYENIKDKASEVKDKVKDKASDAFDMVKDKSNQGFEKVKEWYEDKTGKND